jgi:hypothetical protein
MSKISLLCKNTICFQKPHLKIGKIGFLTYALALVLSVGRKANVSM